MEETRLKKSSLDGSCLFGVESKAFEIFLEPLNGNVAGEDCREELGFFLLDWI